MSFLSALVLLLSSLFAGQSEGQMPPISVIDFYGLRMVSEAQARQALRIKEGDTPPESTLAARLRLEALPGVTQARLEFVCCNKGKTTLYVGLAEKGSPAMEFRPAPTGSVRLYADVLQAGAAFDKAFSEAMQLGDMAEDEGDGQSMMRYPPARAAQQQFVKLAAIHQAQLRDVLRNSADPAQRALAAQVLAYVADKKQVVDDLVYAMTDPSDDVRNNAMRALWLIALLQQRSPDLGIHVPAGPFVDLLNSIVWTDRNKASLTLSELTEKRDPETLKMLRERALPALVDMAKWHAMGHAEPALLILGRIGGMSDADIEADCNKDDRQPIISAALKPAATN